MPLGLSEVQLDGREVGKVVPLSEEPPAERVEESEERQKELEKEWLQQQEAEPEAPLSGSVAYTVRFETTVGTIDIVVRPDWAPHGTQRFLELAAAGDFDDRAFYRAVPSCRGRQGLSSSLGRGIVQFGLPPKRDLPAIPDDPPTGVPFLLGAVAFAAVGAPWTSDVEAHGCEENTRRSTIFICTGVGAQRRRRTLFQLNPRLIVASNVTFTTFFRMFS